MAERFQAPTADTPTGTTAPRPSPVSGALSGSGSGSGSGSASGPQPDWAAEAAERIERVVGTVRDKTTGPALLIARGIVFGLLAAILGMAALVLLIAALIRALSELLQGEVWAAYLLLGLLFTLVGLWLWRKRQTPPVSKDARRR